MTGFNSIIASLNFKIYWFLMLKFPCLFFVLKGLIEIMWILKVLFPAYHPHRWAWQGSRYKYSPEGERIGWICPGWRQASWRAKESKEEQRQICRGFLRKCWRVQIQWVSKTEWHLATSLVSWVYFKNHCAVRNQNAFWFLFFLLFFSLGIHRILKYMYSHFGSYYMNLRNLFI